MPEFHCTPLSATTTQLFFYLRLKRENMRPAVPSFESSHYWDTRFTNEPQPFDWLVPADVLIPPLPRALFQFSSHGSSLGPNTSPQVLHIGSGTSNLSNLLRKRVSPSAILNVDFSQRAIELGIQCEREEFGPGGAKESMSWATADLLNWQDIQSVPACNCGDNMHTANHHLGVDVGDSKPATSVAIFDVVIEKSCADAIACGEDVTIPVPYWLDRTVGLKKAAAQFVDLHPVFLLAINLAALTKPGGTWFAFSYSESRFDCLYGDVDTDEDENRDALKKKGGIPDPAILWSVVKKEEMVAQAEGIHEGIYRPRIAHWMYILKRTDYAIS